MTTELTTTTPQRDLLAPENVGPAYELATRLSKADLLPPHFRGKPENILIVLSLAQNLNVNAMMALQQISVISGKPCLQATMMISLLNNAKKLTGPLRFRFEGEPATPSRRCTAYGTDAATGQEIESIPVSLAMAQAEGWTRNAKYKTLPDVMLQWRAASFFVRAYFPEVVLGLHTAEELEDVAQVRAATPPTQGGMTHAERLASLRQQKQEERDVTPPPATDVEVTVEPPATVPEPTPEPAPTEEGDDSVFLDFLTGIEEATESAELDLAVSMSNDLPNHAQIKTAKLAIMERAKTLGLVWSRAANQFVSAQ